MKIFQSLSTGPVGFLLAIAAMFSARADTVLFQSEPKASTFAAVFQNNSPSTPQIGTTAANGKGTTISIGSFPGNGTPSAALIACATTVGPTDQLGLAVYSSSDKTGVDKDNPLGLGTPSAAPNVFNLAKGQTFTYSVDFHNNFHGVDLLSLFNPKASDAGTSDATALSKGAYLGVALVLTTNAGDASLSLRGLSTFTANQLDTQIKTSPVPPNGTNAWRLILKLTNNGDGTDSVSGMVYSLELKDGVETPTQSVTLDPEKITLGTGAGNYDMDNTTIGLELGVNKIANLNNKFYMTNITLVSGSNP
jgi:hypothetical protein